MYPSSSAHLCTPGLHQNANVFSHLFCDWGWGGGSLSFLLLVLRRNVGGGHGLLDGGGGGGR